MIIKSDNTKGNPYHQSENGQFTSPSYGYHAGDLGKSEHFFNFGSKRGTGHFGTGTYFVGNQEEIKEHNNNIFRGDAPHHQIDFNKYNLFKPGQNAELLHDSLKRVNEMYLNPEDLDYSDYEELSNDLSHIFNVPKDTVEYLLSETLDYSKKINNIDNSEEQKLLDSPSTYFVRKLGYNGIDTRDNKNYDNTKFGSVIYDLDDNDTPEQFKESISKEKELRNKYDIKEISDSYPNLLNRLKNKENEYPSASREIFGDEYDDEEFNEEMDRIFGFK